MHELDPLSRTIWEAFPPAAVPAAEAVTRLGSVTVLLLALSLLYWTADRRRAALLVSYGFAGYGAVILLKAAFGLPRPPAELHLVATDTGPGFPSGHTTAAALIYGGLALEFDRFRRPGAVAALAALVAAVGLSRVVLRVHYVGSVLAGLALGLGLLAALHRLCDGNPTRGFAAGLAVAVPTAALVGATPTVLGIVGACVGGVLATRRLDAVPAPRSRGETALLVVAGLALVAVVQLLEDGFTGALAGVDDFLLVVGVFLLPALVGRVPDGVIEALPG